MIHWLSCVIKQRDKRSKNTIGIDEIFEKTEYKEEDFYFYLPSYSMGINWKYINRNEKIMNTWKTETFKEHVWKQNIIYCEQVQALWKKERRKMDLPWSRNGHIS